MKLSVSHFCAFDFHYFFEKGGYMQFTILYTTCCALDLESS